MYIIEIDITKQSCNFHMDILKTSYTYLYIKTSVFNLRLVGLNLGGKKASIIINLFKMFKNIFEAFGGSASLKSYLRW